jgi:hypothetical protein
MKTFKFTCKQNQVSKVVSLLSKFGKPHIHIKNGFPVITLKHNSSNRKINSFLYDNNVPGATKKKNLKVLKGDKWDISSSNISPGELFVFVENGKMNKVYYTYHTYCDCCGPEFELWYKNGKRFY